MTPEQMRKLGNYHLSGYKEADTVEKTLGLMETGAVWIVGSEICERLDCLIGQPEERETNRRALAEKNLEIGNLKSKCAGLEARLRVDLTAGERDLFVQLLLDSGPGVDGDLDTQYLIGKLRADE